MMVWRVEFDAREDIQMLYAINAVRSFVRRDEGQDLLEYALLVALIALGAVAAITLAGDNVQAIFEDIAAALGVS
jgi:pilus assembly protein Flp/PilA